MQPSKDSAQPDRASAYTIPLLCAGIALIACCLLIPVADENHRLVYEREKLQRDLEQIHKQIAKNDEFLHGLAGDSAVLEFLAQWQLKLVPQGTNVLKLKGENEQEAQSPFLLVTLPPPAELPPYRPVGGAFDNLCRQPRSRLLMMGAGMLLMAFGLVMGSGGSAREV